MIPVRKNIPHIVENREAHVVVHKWKCGWRQTQFQVIQKQGRAAGRKSGDGVSRAGLIQSETAMRVSAAHEKAYRQRNEVGVWRGRLARLCDDRVRKCIFQSDSSRPRKHELLVRSLGFAERMVSRVLHKNSAEVGL